jgi:hypothetical protein
MIVKKYFRPLRSRTLVRISHQSAIIEGSVHAASGQAAIVIGRRNKSMSKKQQPSPQPTERRLKILVSSAVYGYEEMLESIYALLGTYGYEVLMSHKGTIPVDPDESAMKSCLDAVRDCDIFLGLILPSYGSGKELPDGLSITHRELIESIALNKPRWFLVHEHVAVARQLLDPYRRKVERNGRKQAVSPFEFQAGIQFQRTPILSDPRVIDMFELAMRHDITEVKDRRGNWVQQYGPEDDARLFATAQFRRYRDLAEKYLPKLKEIQSITNQIKGGAN